MPGKHRGGLQLQVVHDVAVRIDVVLAATAHLLLSAAQIVDDGGFGRELCIDGQRLDKHAHGARQLLRLASIINRIEQRLLVVVVLGQKVGVGHGEERALVDAILAAELLHTGHVGLKGAQQVAFGRHGVFPVGQKR